jgi:hypothetical protein
VINNKLLTAVKKSHFVIACMYVGCREERERGKAKETCWSSCKERKDLTSYYHPAHDSLLLLVLQNMVIIPAIIFILLLQSILFVYTCASPYCVNNSLCNHVIAILLLSNPLNMRKQQQLIVCMVETFQVSTLYTFRILLRIYTHFNNTSMCHTHTHLKNTTQIHNSYI